MYLGPRGAGRLAGEMRWRAAAVIALCGIAGSRRNDSCRPADRRTGLHVSVKPASGSSTTHFRLSFKAAQTTGVIGDGRDLYRDHGQRLGARQLPVEHLRGGATDAGGRHRSRDPRADRAQTLVRRQRSAATGVERPDPALPPGTACPATVAAARMVGKFDVPGQARLSPLARRCIPPDGVRAPRRQQADAPRRRHRRRRGRRDRVRAGARRARGQGRRRAPRPRAPAARRTRNAPAKLEILTDRSGEEALEPDPPRRRARAGGGRDGALPGREDLDRAADRERLLLRLRLPRGRHRCPRRTSSGSRRRCASTSRPTSRSCARTSPASDALDRFLREAQDYKVELIEDLVEHDGRPDRLAVHERSVHRPVPRPARPVDQADQGVQAPVGRRRVLARRLEPADAHAHLRDRVLLGQGPRGRILERLEQARARDHRRLGPQLGLFNFSERRARDGVLVPRRRPRSSTRSSRSAARWASRAATPRSRPRSSTTARCGRPRGTGTSTGEHMFITESEDRPMGLKPMNCPGHCELYSMKRALLPRPAAPATPSRGCSTATSSSGALHGLLRVRHFAAGRRAHLLHRGADPGRGRGVPRVRVRHLRDLRLRRPARALDAARGADRLRRGVGPRARRHLIQVLDRKGSRTTSTRATARSTAPRSTCT